MLLGVYGGLNASRVYGGINAQKCMMAAMLFKNVHMYFSSVYCEVYPGPTVWGPTEAQEPAPSTLLPKLCVITW